MAVDAPEWERRAMAEYLVGLWFLAGLFPSEYERTRKETALLSAMYLHLSPGTSPSLGQIADDTGIPRGTLSSWCSRRGGFRECLRKIQGLGSVPPKPPSEGWI